MLTVRPLEFMRACQRRYGDIFTLHTFLHGRIVYVADPAAIKSIFTGDPELFHAGEANAAVEPVTGPNSILLLDDNAHLRQRRLLLPPFHGERVKRYRELIAEITTAEVDRWPVRESFALRPRAQAITLEVIIRAVFGIEDGARLTALRQLLPSIFDLSIAAMLLPWLRRDLGPRSPWGRFLRARDAVDDLLYDEIRQRRREAEGERDDVLSLLLRSRDEDGDRMSDRELRDELITLLLAGHETSATAIAWAFERLLRHPRVLERLKGEVAAGETNYLDAVIDETLRVRPVVMDVARKLTGPATIGGYSLRAGTIVMPAIALTQLSAANYSQPNEFRPERFLEDQPTPYTHIPFGGGPRRCLGASFAINEMRVVIPTVLLQVELRTDEPEPEAMRLRGITFTPANGARVVVERRIAPSGNAETGRLSADAAR